MLASEVRRRIDAVWDRVWASGVSNPITAAEYLSTILLLRRLDERRASGLAPTGAESLGEQLATHIADDDAEAVTALMVRVQESFGIGASRDVAADSTWRDLATLRSVLQDVRDLELTDRNHDLLGDVFEYVL